MKILAGIVTYNPDLQRLKENIEAVIVQVDKVIVVDNGSDNIASLEPFLSAYPDITLLKNCDNLGIAKALNQEAEYGINNGYEWLLSLDQDSVVPKGLITEYSKYIYDAMIGMLSCKIKDRNFGELDYNAKVTSGTEYVQTCITSASLLRLSAWKVVKGYYEPMFIDSVDFDICYSLTEHGYRILRTNNIALLHEVGHGGKIRFLGKDVQLTNHSPLRYYYIYRNEIILAKRHNKCCKYIPHLLKSFIVINIYEKNRLAKCKMIIKGIWHAIIGKYGKYEY